jgi:anti-sigma regulatory factor (Ser/Thr protein kinase)
VKLENYMLGRSPAEVSRARRAIAQACAGMSSDLVSIAQLLTSELVTNALTHGTGAIRLCVADEKGHVRVEVTDESRATPQHRSRGTQEENGRGLMLVERLSSAWGVRPARCGPGKTVWFTLRSR